MLDSLICTIQYLLRIEPEYSRRNVNKAYLKSRFSPCPVHMKAEILEYGIFNYPVSIFVDSSIDAGSICFTATDTP